MHVFVISCTHKRENIKSFKKKKQVLKMFLNGIFMYLVQ